MKESLEITTPSGDTYEFDGEWSREDAINLSFLEGQAEAEAEAEERITKWCEDVITKFQERSNENDQ